MDIATFLEMPRDLGVESDYNGSRRAMLQLPRMETSVVVSGRGFEKRDKPSRFNTLGPTLGRPGHKGGFRPELATLHTPAPLPSSWARQKNGRLL